MTFDILSKYSESPYIIIGLEITNDSTLKSLTYQNSISIKQIFNNIKFCEDYIASQMDNVKIVVLIHGDLRTDELIKLEKYSQIDAIYLFIETNDVEKQFQCIYTKVTNRNYSETAVILLKKFWFILGLGVAMLLAYLFPNVGASGGPLRSEYTFKWGCVVIIFLLSGLGLPTRSLTREIWHFRLHIFTQSFNLILIPSVVYIVCLLLATTSFSKILVGGIITMACTTTTISSNVIMTKNAGGNESAALVNAVLGNLLGIVVSPALIWLFMLNVNLNVLNQPYGIHDYLQVLLNLSLLVLVPLIVGQIIHAIWTEKIMWAKEKFHFSELNSLSLLILLWSVLCDLFQSDLLHTIKKVDFLVVIILNAVFYTSFSLLAMFLARVPNVRLCRKRTINDDTQLLLSENGQNPKTWIERWRFSREDTIAIMFCGATKTVAKGLPLINAVNSTNNQKLVGLISLPLIFYHVEQLILGAIEVFLLQRWLKSKYHNNSKELIEN